MVVTGCSVASCPSGGTGATCPCPEGFLGNQVWDGTKWVSTGCTSVAPCPTGASGAGCRCTNDANVNPVWVPGTGWTHTCTCTDTFGASYCAGEKAKGNCVDSDIIPRCGCTCAGTGGNNAPTFNRLNNGVVCAAPGLISYDTQVLQDVSAGEVAQIVTSTGCTATNPALFTTQPTLVLRGTVANLRFSSSLALGTSTTVNCGLRDNGSPSQASNALFTVNFGTTSACEQTCKSMSITCPEGKNPVAAFDTQVCNDQNDCQTKCCKRTCASTPARACTTAGLVPRAKYATIECPAGGGPCAEATCCERMSTCLSKSVTCPPRYVKKAAYDTTASAASDSAAAATAACCEQTCKSMSITCPEGKSPVAAFDTQVCNNQAACDAACCRRTCASTPARACTTAGLVPRAKYATIECPAGGGPCVEATCCERMSTCLSKSVTCPAGYVKKAAYDTTASAASDSAAAATAACCERTCKSMSITCPAGKSPVAAFDTLVCADQAACDAACCKRTCASTPARVCGTGLVPRAKYATIECPAGGDCAEATCCVAEVLCDTHTCTSGSQLKASASSITCPGMPSTCDDATCCEGLCSTHTCPAGLVDKPGKATLPCTTPTRLSLSLSSLLCTDATCCDVLCSTHMCTGRFSDKPTKATVPCRPLCADETCCDVLCSTHTCSAGFQLKPAASTHACPGTPPTCDDATCCDANCAGHTCAAGQQLKPTAATIACAAGGCNDVTCCDPQTCVGFVCAVGFQDKAGKATIACVGACDAPTCCDVLCQQHTCAGNFIDKAGKGMLLCGATVGDCDDAKCCDANCAGHTCAAGQRLKPTAATIACAAGGCNDVTCCNPLMCVGFTCAAGFLDKAGKATIACGAACDAATCCDPQTCVGFVCAVGFQDKAGKATIACVGACDAPTCCVAEVLCDTHTCTSGSQLKASASSITCPGMPSTCDDATCCERLCSTHTCSAGRQLKSTAAAIACPGMPSACTDARCCDVLCTTHTCSAGFQLKSSAPTTTCPGTPAVCDDATCCEKLCSTHTCPAGHVDKPGKATLPCGTPSLCTDATCCDVLCSTHTCSAGFQLKPAASTNACPGTPSTCDDATCCERTCTSMSITCPEGKSPVAWFDTLVCADQAACDAACCKRTCASTPARVCGTGLVPRAKYATIECPAGGDCAEATCCERTCKSSAITCGAGVDPVATFDTLVCADQADCQTKCCKRTCVSTPARACTTAGLVPRAKYATIECPAGGGPCAEATCCERMSTCLSKSVTCPPRYVKKAAYDTTASAASDSAAVTTAACCERTCTSMSITCPEGKNPVAAFDTLVCTDQSACDAACCRRTCASTPARVCGTGLVPRAKYATIECPAGGGPCVEATCCEQTCKSKVVTCGTGYVKLAAFDTIVCPGAAATCVDLCCERTCTHADHSATVCAAIGARTFQLKKESAEIACSTGRTTMPGLADKCDNQLCCDLTRVARDVATVRATLPHTLVSCVENADCRKHGDAGATCDTTTNECTCTNSNNYDSAGKDTFEWLNVRCYRKKETHRVSLIFTRPTTVGDVCHPATATNPIPKDVRAAVVAVYETFSGGKVVSAAFQCISRKVSVSLQVEVVRGAVLNTDKNGYNAAMAGLSAAIRSKLGWGLQTLGTAGPCPGLPNVAKRLSVAGTCLVQKCDIGYYKHKDSRACTQYVAGTTAAADEYDHCTADEDCTWRSHVGWCVDSKCVLSLDTYQRKLKKPTASAKDWCTDDASCRAFGDVAATCSTNVGLGNWCSCVDAAYDYPAGDAVGLCVPTAATAITFSFVVTYETGLACPPTEAQVESFTALIRKVLGDTGAKVAHRCTGTRVVFLGVAVITKTLTSDLTSGDSSAFVDKLVAERAAGKAGAAATLVAPVTADREADALADPYAGLGNAVPTSASVGAPVACPKPFATSTALHNAECIALACQATHTVSGVDCIALTRATPVPVIKPTDDDDSGLSSAETAGLVVGLTFGVLVIVGVVVAAVSCSQKKAEEPKEANVNEPAPAGDILV